jgi:hypothetical protein
MANRSENGEGSELTRRREIVVVYEDNALYAHASLSAPDLVESNHPDTTVVHGCSFATLSDRQPAAEAALNASAADLVVFVFSPQGDLPQEVKLWIENWTTQRGDREGVIVGLAAAPGSPGEIACLKEIYLRQAARRAGMDYVSQVPSASPRSMPDCVDWYGERARQVTSVLDEILRSGSPPPMPLR